MGSTRMWIASGRRAGASVAAVQAVRRKVMKSHPATGPAHLGPWRRFNLAMPDLATRLGDSGYVIHEALSVATCKQGMHESST